MNLSEEEGLMPIRRRFGKINGDRPVDAEDMPPKTYGGSSASAEPRRHGGSAFDNLTDREIDARIRVVTSQLRKLGAFQDTSSIPMGHLTDEQLDDRIRQVEEELRRLNEGAAFDDDGPYEVSRAEKEAVVRQLEMLDHLIEHPDVTIPATSSLDALDDEPARWARAFLSGTDKDAPRGR